MSEERPPEDLATELAKLWTALETWADANVAPDVRDKLREAWVTLSDVADTMASRSTRGDGD